MDRAYVHGQVKKRLEIFQAFGRLKMNAIAAK